MSFLAALDRIENAPLFHAPGFDLARAVREEAAAGRPTDSITLWALGETCPACSAGVHDPCASRDGESHRGRVEVAALRLARLWVPSPGELVMLGPWSAWEWPEGSTSMLVRFVGFRRNGEAIVEADWIIGGRSARKRGDPIETKRERRAFELLAIWRAGVVASSA